MLLSGSRELISGFNVECAGMGLALIFFCSGVSGERTASILRVTEFRSACS